MDKEWRRVLTLICVGLVVLGILVYSLLEKREQYVGVKVIAVKTDLKRVFFEVPTAIPNWNVNVEVSFVYRCPWLFDEVQSIVQLKVLDRRHGYVSVSRNKETCKGFVKGNYE